MTLHHCTTCFSLQVEQLSSAILLLKTPLAVHQLTLTLILTFTLTLTLPQMHSWFPALMNLQFVASPQRALWDHPERNQTTLQTSTFSTNIRVGSLATIQNLSSRLSKLEKLFTDEIATYSSVTAGIHSQYVFLYDKVRQLEAGNSDAIISKIPSVKFVFNSTKMARPSCDPLVEPVTSF